MSKESKVNKNKIHNKYKIYNLVIFINFIASLLMQKILSGQNNEKL